MSDYLRNAHDLTLNHPNLSNVVGDQHNHHTHVTTVSRSRLWIRGNEEEEGEFEQYPEVKRADVELVRSICNYRPDEAWRAHQLDCEKKFFMGEIARGSVQRSGVLVVDYEGREAREAWLEDFKRCTGFLSVDSAHLLAIGRSKIPLLIFTRELVPANHFLDNVGYLGRTYFVGLSTFRLSLDGGVDGSSRPQKGMLCRGPEGPFDTKWRCLRGFENIENVPSNVELLQEDVFRRFLIGSRSEWADHLVLRALDEAQRMEYADLECPQPIIIPPLNNTPIAWSGVTEWWHDISNDKDGVLLGNGLTGFMFDDPPTETSLDLSVYHPRSAWLSQAWNILHAHGLSLKDDLSRYQLIIPHIRLELSFSQSDRKRRRRRWQPIFLFIRPLPSTLLRSCTTSSLHYWSFDAEGQSPLSPYMCRHLGLPAALKLEVYRCFSFTWSNDVYKTVYEYQVARGFDPRTADFARSLGCDDFTYEPIHNNSDGFEEVDLIGVPSPPSAEIESDWTSVEDAHSLLQNVEEASDPSISAEDWIFAEGETRDSSEHSESCSPPQARPTTTQVNQKGSFFAKMKW